MASPLPTSKATVDLTGGTARVSRIRRDPPPAVKPKAIEIKDLDGRGTMTMALGITATSLALVAVLIGLASLAGWTPRQVMLFL